MLACSTRVQDEREDNTAAVRQPPLLLRVEVFQNGASASTKHQGAPCQREHEITQALFLGRVLSLVRGGRDDSLVHSDGTLKFHVASRDALHLFRTTQTEDGAKRLQLRKDNDTPTTTNNTTKLDAKHGHVPRYLQVQV